MFRFDEFEKNRIHQVLGQCYYLFYQILKLNTFSKKTFYYP